MPSQEGNDRGQSAAGDINHQEAYKPGGAVCRFDSGRKHRIDESGRQIRISPWLQVLHLSNLVDSPSLEPCNCGPGTNHPHSSPYD